MREECDFPSYGKCQLCGKTTQLMLSHIIPKFITNWIKRTSATGYISQGTPDRKRIQDSHKLYLFCNNCEQILSRSEKKFAERIFNPYKSNKSEFEYSEWLILFSYSIVYRTICISKIENERNNEREKIENLKLYLKDCILNNNVDCCPYDLHIYFNEHATWHENFDIEFNFLQYQKRATDLGILISNDFTNIASYSLLAGIVIWMCIDPPVQEEWQGTLIEKKGCLNSKFQIPPYHYMDYIVKRYNKIQQSKNVSERDQERIVQHFINNQERVKKSDSYNVMCQELRRKKMI